MNRFTAYRTLDISNTHNSDQVNAPDEPQYKGVVFDSGKCIINWCTAVKSVSVFDSFEECMRIHGHPEYGTRIEFHDEALPLPWDVPPDYVKMAAINLYSEIKESAIVWDIPKEIEDAMVELAEAIHNVDS